MIKRPNNWNDVKAISDRPKLPVGAYVCMTKKAAVQSTEYGDVLAILFDIAEGEHTGFFTDDFAANTNPDKKWRGVLRVWLPKDDGSEKDEFTKQVLKGMVTSFEKSNPGYVFDWNENSLAGKNIGILFRNEEWEMNGKTGWTARPFRAISVDSVRAGTYTIPKEKPIARADSAFAMPKSDVNGFIQVDDDDDLPF